MTPTIVRDPGGREHVIANVEDMNRLVAAVERRRDELAELMLGDDEAVASKAETQSDYIEEVFLPLLQADLARVQSLLDAEAAVERRRAKARAIKERGA
ncbi:hypothetical protein [Sphingomonas olei]|uniref:Uncharacterized protein n=1 Tax=Sphingomonas olei TaxID=1886787 RepID=A0ABY2QDJ5_9SPHN|nr:hypothetical protein [Sphingomonas olei]THG37244.1 hypothetical protein E5988_16030 [Sphingomonas olei]